jgi:hypothetical protein
VNGNASGERPIARSTGLENDDNTLVHWLRLLQTYGIFILDLHSTNLKFYESSNALIMLGVVSSQTSQQPIDLSTCSGRRILVASEASISVCKG